MTLNQSNPAMAVINAEVRAADRRFLVRADQEIGAPGAGIGSVDLYRANGFTLAIPLIDVVLVHASDQHGMQLTRLWSFGQN